MGSVVVAPAYGRILNSRKAVREHYEAGKDFVVLDLFHEPGRYLNREEVERYGLTLQVRYGKRGEKVCVLP